jgi:hypothetical protein
MLKILERVLKGYDDLISERLSRTDIYSTKARKGLGRHLRKGDPEERFCRVRKIRKRGYRKNNCCFSTVFGKLNLRLTTSLLERVFREIGRRLKRIAWGWSDKAATNISKMIMIRQYSRDKWEQYWKEKLGIKGYFDIQFRSIELSPCEHF